MRIERLSLDFFGLFTDKILDFGKAGQVSDFHLIHGSNDAGKTTMMEGYLRLLYGFPHKEPYGFKHKRRNLRVSGLLDIGGETRLFTRLPSRDGNLRGEADAALPETAIASHLGGLSLKDYRSLLCLDDDTIEKGGEDIASAQGDIGRLLFSAAVGIADLNAVLEQARSEASGLYKKRASTTRVAVLKRELDKVESGIRDLDASAHSWRKLKDTLQAARDEEATARVARDELRAEQDRIAPLRQALPGLDELERLLDEVADFAEYPDRIYINPEELVKIMTERGRADAELRRLKDSLDETEAARAALVLDEERLTLAERLDELRDRMRTAALERPRHEHAHKQALADMTRIARDLGAPHDCDVTRLLTSQAEIATLENLRDRMREAAAAQETGEREIAGLRERITQAEEAHQALLEDPPVRTGLIDLLTRFDADGLATSFAKATQAIASADVALQEALDALTVKSSQFVELPDCPVDPSTAADLAKRHADLTDEITRAEDELKQLEEGIAALAAKITGIADSAGIATDEEAQDARAQRDVLWQAHRDALSAESADHFVSAMKRVDDIDAVRLAHATELDELRKLGRDMAEAEASASEIREQRARLARQLNEIETQIEGFTTEIGLPTLSPSVFSDWVALHAKAGTESWWRDTLAEQHRETMDRAKQLRQELAPLVALEHPTFDAALAAARPLAKAERVYLDDVRAASDRTAAINAELDGPQRKQNELEDQAEQASEAWRTRVRDLFGDILSPDKLADALGLLRDLRGPDAKRQQAERQLSAIQDGQRRYSEEVYDLGVSFDLGDHDSPEMFRRLREIAEQAKAEKSRHEELGARLDEGAKRRAEFEAKLEGIDRAVAELGALFPGTVDTSTPDALRVAVSTALDVITKRRKIAELGRRILDDLPDDLPPRGIDDDSTPIGKKTVSALKVRVKSLETNLDLAEERLSTATVDRANAERCLHAVTSSAEMAELVERRATLQMQIEEVILDYLQWNLGLRIAEDAIDRYRDKHWGEMMASTEQTLVELTDGACQKLLTETDGSSEILRAVDTSGTAGQVGDMPKETRLRLYLALRAAACEQMARRGVCLPFFYDNGTETFDEDRTRAACRLMERIGRSGQAIYLTRHRDAVEIAQEVCDAQPVIHEI